MDRHPYSSSSQGQGSGGAPRQHPEALGGNNNAPPRPMSAAIPRRVPPAGPPPRPPSTASQIPPCMGAAIPRRFSNAAPPPSASLGYPPQRSMPPQQHSQHGQPVAHQQHKPPPPSQGYYGPPSRQVPPLRPPQPPSTFLSGTIPKRSVAPALPTHSHKREPKSSQVSLKSERPMVIRIKMTGVPLHLGGIPRLRSSGRTVKRKRQTYQEANLTDSDDFVSDEDEQKDPQRKRLKKLKIKKAAASPAPSDGRLSTNSSAITDTTDAADQLYLSQGPILATADTIEAPPPGVLSNLWYSRECVLHLFVVEKVLGWKTRPVVKLDFSDARPDDLKFLDPIEASAISTKVLTTAEIWKDTRKRMEQSRINPTQCPVVLKIAAAKEEAAAKKRPGEGDATASKPRYKLMEPSTDTVEREEVLLVKWRGRSYLHCSWERRKDLEKFDPSNSTARHKIRRYLQAQEVAMGKNWKQVLEEERASIPDLHPHQPTAPPPDAATDPNKPQGSPAAAPVVEEEELFPPEYLEVERILACDENEMDMSVLARQRALNLRAEQEAQRLREEEEERENKLLEAKTSNDKPSSGDAAMEGTGTADSRSSVRQAPPSPTISALSGFINGEAEAPWDPEDNVRYVIKWKGLQYSHITWEYWRDVKTDAVDQAEDFWSRQRTPEWDQIKSRINRPHPHVRDFRKLTESPKYGVSKRSRPIADLGIDAGLPEDDKETDPGFRLRGYQLEGVNWLLFNWWNRRSCILADEMGLGKTIQTVGFLHQLHESSATQVRGPFLIVAPLSLIGQWQSESQSWAPDMNVVFYHGSADARDFLVKQEFYYTDQFTPKPNAVKLKKNHVTKFHILITTYEVVLKDVAVLSKIRWKALVVDEAHRLKNPKARLFEELASVPRDFCLLLTGTPLQNSTEELWALLHFSDPVAFASKDAFVDKFGQLTDSKQVSDLHTVLRPYLLRRVKEDVEKSLPPKEETILEVTLTPIQKTFYKAIYERNTAFLYKGSKPSNAPSLMNVMMELRKCCNHPFLVRGAEERILIDAAAPLKDKKDENGNAVPIDYLKLFGEHLVKSSGKMVLLSKLLPKLYSGGHKVLVFSQMVRVLDLLEELLKMKRYRYERLDGSTSAGARSAAVDRFHRKSCQRFVMLLSTRAGGLGLNLTAADTVIIFDSDWNPQNDLQAMARAHRIGQTRAVRVYRLLTSKTYEMHMFHSASMKLGLDRAVLAHQRQQGEDGEETKSKGKNDRQLQAKEIDELLKKGAYDVFRDDDDKEAQQFMETDIDQLLERSARKVTYGSTDTSMSSGLGSFSKASFVADTGDGEKDVDLDDPNFWEKAVGLDAPVETPDEIAAMLDDGVKRSRKQVQVFDPYAAFAEAEQKKKDKIATKAKEEKEAKERLRLEKKQRKLEEKERKRREREDARGRLFGQSPLLDLDDDDDTPPKDGKSSKSKKMRKSDRKRALKRVENEDPILERLKQAWEIPQRNRATSASLRFGFARFCKIRNDSNLTSLPIQDLEVFFRQYMYQLALQVAVPLMTLLQSKIPDNRQLGDSPDGALRSIVSSWLGTSSERETDWMCDSVSSVLKMQMEVMSGHRFLRMSMVLAEPSYVADLRRGAAFRALRRIGLLSRLNSVIEDAVDSVLLALGNEELGKRGCTTKDLSSLDVDLKARLVTAEEMSLALSATLDRKCQNRRAPAQWWDRRCDIALIIGTFIHGFGNYESMRNDEDLPYANMIRRHSRRGDECCRSYLCFDAAARAARKVFDDALDSAKAKAQEEAHLAVAAAVAATKLAEQEGQNGSAATGSAPETTEPESVVSKDSNTDVVEDSVGLNVPTELDKDDSHYVTLVRLSESTRKAFQTEEILTRRKRDGNGDSSDAEKTGGTEDNGSDTDVEEEWLPLQQRLPMPDARVLDDLLLRLVECIEGGERKTGIDEHASIEWETPKDVSTNNHLHAGAFHTVLGTSLSDAGEMRSPYKGIGFSGSQCGSSHRSLDDASNFGIGAAATALVHVASGTDSPRYLRAIGVPMNVTRYCVSGLVYSDIAVVEQLLVNEKSTSFSSQNGETDGKSDIAQVTSQPPQVVSSDHVAGSPDESGVIPPLFGESVRLRAGVCIASLYFGYPAKDKENLIDSAMLKVYRNSSTMDVEEAMFAAGNFLSVAGMLGWDDKEKAKLPDHKTLRQYMDSVFLPFCVKLCVMGNGPSTRNARGSKGAYETAFGVSLDPEPTLPRQSPIPDPTMSLAAHSTEAVACASAILRRRRLMRSIQYIVGGHMSLDTVVSFLKGPVMRQEDLVSTVPCWWCPWIHDLGLLVHAAKRGLFGILRDRSDEAVMTGTVFERDAIEQHVQDTFFVTRREQSFPKSMFKDGDSNERIQQWIKVQTNEFPTVNVIERRLALVCSHVTATASGIDDDYRYDNLPMFDHGGWPRN